MSITRDSLWTLEEYARRRREFRAQVLQAKQARRVALGEHITLHFENELTIRYQIQEMLRIEKTFEEAGIREELEAYAPLVPDGHNLKATMMIEYADANERKTALQRLVGVEHRVYLQVEGRDRVYATADEDLERSTADKTSAVHFLRWELDRDMIEALKYGVSLAAGVDHPAYNALQNPLDGASRASLVGDLV